MDDLIRLHGTLHQTLSQMNEQSKQLEQGWKQKEQELLAKLEEERNQFKEEKEAFQAELDKFQATQAEMRRCAKGSADKIRLNVGGTLFSMYRDTLLVPGSFFEAMLGSSQWQPDADGEYFIDRNPRFFGSILSYLRLGMWDRFTPEEVKLLHAELDYYLIPKPMWPVGISILRQWSPKSASCYTISGPKALQTNGSHELIISEDTLLPDSLFAAEVEIMMRCCGGLGLAKEGTAVGQDFDRACFVKYAGSGIITGTQKGAVWPSNTYFKIGILKDENHLVKFFFNGELQGTAQISNDVGAFRLVVDLDDSDSSATLLENLSFVR
eukprot:TRINITY_DN15818_c0_g1_i5.p1 TRINITY_DN15818_c0_g1~~TRINITY_DN15818_c0_g1_i5.p1  ORF type:complete len:325 (-),score=48.02 TRINITY_DN15818_c0_g1_i5:142-1116(-)